MILDGIILLLLIAGITGLIAAINRNRKFLMGTGIIFIFLAAIIFTSGVQIQETENITETAIDENTTEIHKDPVYTSLEEQTEFENSETYLGVILVGFSIYAVLTGAIPGGNWR